MLGGETPSRDDAGDPDRCREGLKSDDWWVGEYEAKGGMDEPEDGGVGVSDWLPVKGPGEGDPEGL